MILKIVLWYLTIGCGVIAIDFFVRRDSIDEGFNDLFEKYGELWLVPVLGFICGFVEATLLDILLWPIILVNCAIDVFM